PRPILEIRPEVPQAVWEVIVRMMAKEPGQRYQSPGAVAAALAPFVPTMLPPPPESEMPALSPAATGPGSSTDTLSYQSRTVAAPSTSVTPAPGVTPSSPRTAPLAAGPLAPAVQEEAWEKLAGDTVEGALGTDTPHV